MGVVAPRTHMGRELVSCYEYAGIAMSFGCVNVCAHWRVVTQL
jgi:hypothetical protein